ncbi:MAG TPA: 30S ribosomal protein S20 [Dehalococcoidia bacterium]|nr:30S ribosomal protein S20 [Dehalococcoidia bacterium]
MPVTKSAQKRVRETERKRLRNKPILSLCKSNIAKAERLIFLGEFEAARQAAAVAISSLDRAAEKGVIHSNNAARRKSRLMQKLNEAQASAPAKAKPKAAKARPKAEKPAPEELDSGG